MLAFLFGLQKVSLKLSIEEVFNSLESMTFLSEAPCFGLSNGTIEVTETIGGEAPFMYSLNGGQFEMNINALVVYLHWVSKYN